MAGRGRGRGKAPIILSGDQVGKQEILPPILQPPASYPLLDYKPLPVNISQDLRYLYNFKKDYAEHMFESPYRVLPIVEKKDIERYSDTYNDIESRKQKYETIYNWSRMPSELKPQPRKRKSEKIKEPAMKKQKEIDIDSKLQELEKKEVTQHSDTEENEKDEDEAEDKDLEDKLEEEEEEVDEEMDEGTDYVNNYFDNGENYEDDEENLDDGAIF